MKKNGIYGTYFLVHCSSCQIFGDSVLDGGARLGIPDNGFGEFSGSGDWRVAFLLFRQVDAK